MSYHLWPTVIFRMLLCPVNICHLCLPPGSRFRVSRQEEVQGRRCWWGKRSQRKESTQDAGQSDCVPGGKDTHTATHTQMQRG